MTYEARFLRPNSRRRALALLDEVDPEGIVITKRGKPVAKLMPFDTTDSSALIGALSAFKLRIKGDILFHRSLVEC